MSIDPRVVTLSALFAMAMACDDRRASAPEGEPSADAALDAGPTGDAETDGGADPDAAPPPPLGQPGLLFVARQPAEGGVQVLVRVDPTSGAVERWGLPLPIAADDIVQEVMHDPEMSRVVLRYEFQPEDPGNRGNNFTHAGYLAAERGEPWRTLVHSEDAVVMMVEPGLDRLGLFVSDPRDSDGCLQHVLMRFDGTVIAEHVDAGGQCAPEPRLWAFGPDGAYTLHRRGDDLLIASAGVPPADARFMHASTRQPGGPDRIMGVFETSVVLSSAGGPSWVDLEGQPVEGPPLPARFFGPMATLFFDGGDLWRLVDRGAERIHDAAGAELSFDDYVPEPLPEHPDVPAELHRLWLGFTPDGAWAGALGAVQYLSAIESAPQAIEVNEHALELWQVGRDGTLSTHRVSRLPWPPAARFDSAGRAALWPDGCGLMRVDLQTAEVVRFDYAADGLEILEVDVAEPGWWGGIDAGHGLGARSAAGTPVINADHSPHGANCR